MSKADAIRDGIEIVNNRFGQCYMIPCANCGNKYGSRQYTGNRVYICPTCRELIRKKRTAHIEHMALSIPDAETKEEKRYRKLYRFSFQICLDFEEVMWYCVVLTGGTTDGKHNKRTMAWKHSTRGRLQSAVARDEAADGIHGSASQRLAEKHDG